MARMAHALRLLGSLAARLPRGSKCWSGEAFKGVMLEWCYAAVSQRLREPGHASALGGKWYEIYTVVCTTRMRVAHSARSTSYNIR